MNIPVGTNIIMNITQVRVVVQFRMHNHISCLITHKIVFLNIAVLNIRIYKNIALRYVLNELRSGKYHDMSPHKKKIPLNHFSCSCGKKSE